jgi:hypothetical protein
MWGGIPTPYGPCSYCYSLYHHVRDCPTAGQFFNYSYEHMNTLFSITRHGEASLISHGKLKLLIENYAPQFHKLYHQTYSSFNDQSYTSQYQATP